MPLHPDLQQVGSSDMASRITWIQANLYAPSSRLSYLSRVLDMSVHSVLKDYHFQMRNLISCESIYQAFFWFRILLSNGTELLLTFYIPTIDIVVSSESLVVFQNIRYMISRSPDLICTMANGCLRLVGFHIRGMIWRSIMYIFPDIRARRSLVS